MTKIGFTLFVQGGLQIMTSKGEATDSEGNTESDEETGVIPLSNINLGWSF